jgi:hypothetical protein
MMINIETASKLANVYGECVSQMNDWIEKKSQFMTLKKKIHQNHNEQLNVANNGIKILQGEAIKYRKFDNYLRKEPIKSGFNK